MPHTVPLAPPVKPEQKPAPSPERRQAPPAKPQREPDPFNPEWPKTRPTPEPKAKVRR
jgi:hypothetical protein